MSTALARFSDRPGVRPRLMLGAVAASAAGNAIFAFVRDYWVLLGTAATLLAIGGSTYPQVFAHARELLDRRADGRTAMRLNYLRTVVSASWIVGPPAATALLGLVGFRGVYVAGAGFMVVAAGAVRWMTRGDRPGVPAPDGVPGAGDVATRTPTAPATGRTRMPWLPAVAFVAVQIASSLGVQAMPLFFVHDLHAPVASAGAVLGLCAGLEIPLMIAGGALAGRVPLRRLILAGAALGAIYYATITASTTVWQVAAAQVVNAAFIACIQGLGITWFQDLTPAFPGRATTMFANTNRVAGLLAGPVFALAQTFGYRFAYGTGAVMCGFGFALLSVVVAQGRPLPRMG